MSTTQMTEKMASLFTNLGFGKDKDTGDARYFQRGKIQELRAELNGADGKNDPKFAKKKIAMKKVVANMTMGNDMSPLFPDVINCLSLNVLEIKKMVYLYLVHYAKSKPDMAVSALPSLSRDALDANPLLRAMAVRTMSYINVDKVTDAFSPILRTCLMDNDPYVRKTAVMSVPKVYMHDPNLIEGEGFMDLLYDLLNDPNAMVLSNAVAALTEISDRSEVFDFVIDISMANKLMTAVNDCTEYVSHLFG
jgi:AP-2 complex subunit beta-1